MSGRPSIAIIGSGISGLSAAFHLHRDFAVTVYEKNHKAGGHTDTHDVEINSQSLRIDTGFIVFCRRYYPLFSSMLDTLGVKCKPTRMSFSVHNRDSGIIYNATSLNTLFCQRRNLWNPRFYRMLFDLLRFYRSANKILRSCDADISVSEYLDENHYSAEFKNDHLFPMISALWSAPPQRVAQFPIRHLVDFMHRHGMLNLLLRPQWTVVEGGSDSYVQALMAQLDCRWKIGHGVQNVIRSGKQVSLIIENGEVEQFDAVVFAAHPNQVLAMLDSPGSDERRILGQIDFQNNQVLMHTDASIMPPIDSAWASWNTEVPTRKNNRQSLCTANYWMNELQGLSIDCNIFTSLNSSAKIDADKVLLERHYAHPVFTAQTVAAQREKPLLDGSNNSYFVGAYWGWGFHEDGVRSAVEVSQLIKQQFGISHAAA